MRVQKNPQRFLRLGVSVLALLALCPALSGQSSPEAAPVPAGPVISDWSTHHIVFSKPATAAQAERMKKDFRYVQQLRRQSPARLAEQFDESAPHPVFDAGVPYFGENNTGGDWSEDMGTGASMGALNYPAKYAFKSTNANCGSAATPDYVVYATGLTGSSTQASIVAFDNLYSGCGGTVPSIYWAYNTFGGTVKTSPVISADGTQIAFVQSTTGNDAELVVLRWAASNTETIGSPLSLTRVRNSAYPTCTAPCMSTALLRNSAGTQINSDTNSSLFYDYTDDIAYVGDDAGWLHQFGPVFNGVPAEVLSAGWPVQVNSASPTALTSPVYDFNSGRVFVADVGGYAYRVGPETAFVATSSGPLDVSSSEGGTGIVVGPIIDSTAEVLYIFAASDGSAGCSGGADCSAVYELPVDFPEDDTGLEATVGSSTISGKAPSPLYLGALDSAYENSTNATGNLYVCGNTGGPPVLYQVAIEDGVLGGTTAGPVLSTSSIIPCSSVTDIRNPNVTGGATEWLFTSVENGGISNGCASGGCVFNFKDTPWLPSTSYSVGQEILDDHFQIQVVKTAGTSGTTAPFWSGTLGGTTVDSTVRWLDQGQLSAITLSAWVAHHSYTKNSKILDANGNVELVTSAGTKASGGTVPTFSTIAGVTTSDGTAGLVWTNVGALGTSAAPQSGGTSGIIVDNTVGSGTLAGASQVYFSTLGSQTCGTSGTGGCAVQASQAGLQ